MVAIEEQLGEITNLLQRLYKESNRQFIPKFPWVLVYVLDKEYERNGIILSAIDQNKIIHEGIVLATWRPFTKNLGMIRENGERIEKTVAMKSDVEIGEHVLFPHWCGSPITGLPDKKFRIVSEFYEKSEIGGIIGKVEYEHSSTKELLKDILTDKDRRSVVDMVTEINARLLMVDRNAKSVTLSGT